jgi:hypothetical protein
MTFDPRTLAIFGVLAFLILVASAIVASAEHVPNYQGYRPAYIWNVHEWREVRHRRRNAKVWREEYRPRRSAADDRCRPPVAVVGDQYATEGGAKSEADRNWMGTVRWMWGERFLDRANAQDVRYECGRSSVGSVAGQVFYRCRISARPCPPDQKGGD